ncbi:MAG: hypothetical protein V4653_09945, partial [Pseudomonadota bacterium]
MRPSLSRSRLLSLLPIIGLATALAGCGSSTPRAWDGTNAQRISNANPTVAGADSTAPEDLYAEGMRQLRAQNLVAASRAFDA